MEKVCGLADTRLCPLPISEDRFEEAVHFMTQLEREYHDPRLFRYNLNAVLAALRSTVELLTKEMETFSSDETWKRTKQIYRADPDLQRVAAGRNITLHQKAIYDGSNALVGLFRGRRHKLSVGGDVAHDMTSQQMLRLWQESAISKTFLDPSRPDVGDQYGVWRRYDIPALSTEDDALVACWKAVIRTNDYLNEAHRIYGYAPFGVPAELLLAPETILKVTVLLESDVDPSLPAQWGWE